MTIRVPDAKHVRLKRLAARQGVSLNKLIEEWSNVALAQFDAETRFLVRAGRGDPHSGLALEWGSNYNNAPCCSRLCFRLWSRVVALFQRPRCNRWAISRIVSVVSRRQRAANANFSGALRFRSSKSARVQPRRCNSSPMIGSDSVFELRAPKRGKRLRWEDEDKQATTVQFIAHHRDVGVICWRKADLAEVEELLADGKGGRQRTCELTEVLHAIGANPGERQGFYKELVSEVLKCSDQAVQRAIQECVDQGWVRFTEQGRMRLYHVTEKGREKALTRQSAHAWQKE